MEIGQKIRTARKAAKLTQEQLANKSGVATITIRQYETGKRQPRLEQLHLIAAALNIPWYTIAPDELYGEAVMAHVVERCGLTVTGKSGLEDRLVEAFYNLNPSGKLVAVDRVKELTENPRYKLDWIAPPSQPVTNDEDEEG